MPGKGAGEGGHSGGGKGNQEWRLLHPPQLNFGSQWYQESYTHKAPAKLEGSQQDTEQKARSAQKATPARRPT